METGMKNSITITVTEDLTAKKTDEILLPVFGTPNMIALIEKTCARCILPELAEGEGSVGMSLDVKHVAPTPVGKEVRCEVELTEVNGKKLTFEAKVYDENGLVGTGIHKRAIINNDAFMARLAK